MITEISRQLSATFSTQSCWRFLGRGSLGSHRYPWVIAWCSRHVSESVGTLETLAGIMGQTGISSRYWAHCSLGLRFSCQAWKPCGGSPAPRLALRRGGVVWLLCSGGWSAAQAGRPSQVVSCGTVKSFGEPHSVGMSNCLVGAMWPNWRCTVVMWAGVVVLSAIPGDFQYPELLGTFWGWLMGPHSGLSLRGGTGYPAPHWNLDMITKQTTTWVLIYANQPDARRLAVITQTTEYSDNSKKFNFRNYA